MVCLCVCVCVCVCVCLCVWDLKLSERPSCVIICARRQMVSLSLTVKCVCVSVCEGEAVLGRYMQLVLPLVCCVTVHVLLLFT